MALREVPLDPVTDIPTHMALDMAILTVTYPDRTLMAQLLLELHLEVNLAVQPLHLKMLLMPQ